MFKYGISFSTIFWSVFTLFLTSSLIFVVSAVIYSNCTNGNKKEKITSILIIIGLWFMVFLGTWSIFYTCQKTDYEKKYVQEILNENYAGYTDFKNKDNGGDSENSFMYEGAKYEWEYDESDKKLTVTCYGVPHEDAVFVDGKKWNK